MEGRLGYTARFQIRFILWLKPIFRQPVRLIWLILALGFALRLAWLLFARPVPVSDFEGYRQLAINLLDRHFLAIQDRRPIAYPGTRHS